MNLKAGTRNLRSKRAIRRKAMLDWEEVLFASDADELEAVVKRFYVELIQLSWDNWNLELGADLVFDLQDPAVVKALEGAGSQVRKISETTRQKLQEVLQQGADRGWSIDHLVRGDADLGIPGLRSVVEETYKGRAQSIARTEMAIAQQTAGLARYQNAGLTTCLVLDNGFDDSAPQCVALGQGGQGSIVPIEWAAAHYLGHPRCVRATTAAFPDDGPVDESALAAWEAAGGDS